MLKDSREQKDVQPGLCGVEEIHRIKKALEKEQAKIDSRDILPPYPKEAYYRRLRWEVKNMRECEK